MGLKRVTKKFLKYLIPTLVVLLIIPFSELNRNSKGEEDVFGTGPIRFALKLDEKLYEGYVTGYCYEMAERFAGHLKDSVEIFIADSDADYLDSLRLDSLDILAVPFPKIPDSEEFLSFQLGDVPAAWVIKADKKRQREIIRWLNNFKGTDEYAAVQDRFFKGYNPYRKGVKKVPGIISPYDDLIKRNAKTIGWDWKMFAALIWSESRFRIQARSPKGAVGLMQMMPRTADRYEIEDLLDPKENIEAGAAYITRLQSKFRNTAADGDELVKFTLAAYNAGEGRIYDCINLARSQGIDTSTWESLCTVLPQMSQDSILFVEDVRHGKFKGRETVAYVKAVLNRYDIFNGATPRYQVQPTDTSSVLIEDEDDVERVLLSPDSLSRIDSGDEQARDQEKEHNDKPGEEVGGKHRR